VIRSQTATRAPGPGSRPGGRRRHHRLVRLHWHRAAFHSRADRNLVDQRRADDGHPAGRGPGVYRCGRGRRSLADRPPGGPGHSNLRGTPARQRILRLAGDALFAGPARHCSRRCRAGSRECRERGGGGRPANALPRAADYRYHPGESVQGRGRRRTIAADCFHPRPERRRHPVGRPTGAIRWFVVSALSPTP